MTMNRREKQFRMNLNDLIGGYLNGQMDYGEEEYPNMTADQWFEYIRSQVYDMQVFAPGACRYAAGICKDLRFLGNKRMREIIIEEAEAEGLLKKD